MTHALLPHPSAAASQAVLAVAAGVAVAGATLRFEYRLRGSLGELAIPRRTQPRRADRLWQHTCFEAFVAAASGTAYYELNFSPSREWAAYAFDAYRQGMRLLELEQAPMIDVVEGPNELRVTATAEIGALAAAPWPWRVGLTAVVEASDGRRSHYALRHVRPEPDFHDAASFAVLLEGSAR